MWVSLTRICLTVTGVVLIALATPHWQSNLLDGSAEGTVTGIERLPSDRRDDRNYVVGYQFMTDAKRAANGSFLLQNPPSLSEIPRVGTYVAVSYSSLNPAVNQPWDGHNHDFSELFQAEFLTLVGIVLLAGGISLR